MSKHTKGPWIAKRAVNGSKDFGIVTTKSDVLAEVFSDIRFHGERCPEVIYNALLIAAAPELLDALRWYVENDDVYDMDGNEFWLEGRDRAVLAISKATGEQA